MEKINQVLESTNKAMNKSVKKHLVSNTKGKWREIESIRDKFQFEKDMRMYEDSLEYMLEEF